MYQIILIVSLRKRERIFTIRSLAGAFLYIMFFGALNALVSNIPAEEPPMYYFAAYGLWIVSFVALVAGFSGKSNLRRIGYDLVFIFAAFSPITIGFIFGKADWRTVYSLGSSLLFWSILVSNFSKIKGGVKERFVQGLLYMNIPLLLFMLAGWYSR